MLRVVIYILILVSHLLVASSVFAWQMPVEVSINDPDGKRLYNRLVIGMEMGATDGFDNLWDAPAILSRPDPDAPILLRAYLKGEDTGREVSGILWKDIRSARPAGDATWKVAIDSVPVGYAVVIKWDMPAGVIKGEERLVLKDNDNLDGDGHPVEVDVTQAESYTYVSAGDEPRSLSLVLLSNSGGTSSGSGGVFGCGTIKYHRDGGSAGGRDVLSVVVLFLPVIFFRLLRGLRPLAMTKNDASR